jgi:hypothetical protein
MLLKQPWVTLTRLLDAAKCYWPGVTAAAPELAAGRARAGLATGAGPVTCLGSLLCAAAGRVLCHGPDMRPPRLAALAFLPDELD